MTQGVPGTHRARAVMVGAIVCVVILIIAGGTILSTLQSPDTSAGAGEQVQTTRDNLVLGLAILLILGTFGILAYYYKKLGFGSKR